MSFLGIEIFRSSFRYWDLLWPPIYRMSRPNLDAEQQNAESRYQKEISIPKMRLRPPRCHKNNISIPKKAHLKSGIPRKGRQAKVHARFSVNSAFHLRNAQIVITLPLRATSSNWAKWKNMISRSKVLVLKNFLRTHPKRDLQGSETQLSSARIP